MTPGSPHHFRALTSVILFLTFFAACGNGSRKDSIPSQSSSPETQPLQQGQTAPTEIEVLAIYRFDPLHGRVSVESTVDVPSGSDRDSSLESLLSRVNAQLTGRRIQAAGVRKEDQLEILIRDLVDLGGYLEPTSRYNSFQGSAGGSAIQVFLVTTFLQQQYDGDWFDGVTFLLNGQPMMEMDHVNLSGEFYRKASLREYFPVQINESGDISDEEFFSFLRISLDLPQDTMITLARPRWGQGGDMIVFFTSNAAQLAQRGVIRVKQGVFEILNFEEDPCSCTRVEAQAMQLVHDRREFVVTRFSPMGGTCVGSDVVRILAVGEDASLDEVWSGTTFEADGSQSRIAAIEFTDQDGDGDFEIVLHGKRIDCGDDCLCREGPVREIFQTIHVWDAERRVFVPIC